DLTGGRDAEVAGFDGKVEMRGEATGPRRDGRAGDERGKLVPADRDPLARRRDLVLADRGPGSPDGRTLHPPEPVGHDGEREVDVPELGEGRDPVQAELWHIYLSLAVRSEEHTSELQSRVDLVCRLLLAK